MDCNSLMIATRCPQFGMRKATAAEEEEEKGGLGMRGMEGEEIRPREPEEEGEGEGEEEREHKQDPWPSQRRGQRTGTCVRGG